MQNKSFGKNILQGIRGRIGKLIESPYAKVNVGPLRKIYFKHLAPGKIRVHRLFGHSVQYLSSTELLHGLKEIFIDEIYKQALPPSANIIDCGANIGLSVIYLKRLFPDARILAFEPDRMNFQLLQENVKAFDLSNVELREEAVWIRKESMSFSGGGSMSSRLMPGNQEDTVTVKATRLMDCLDRKIDFLKMDIEGAEYEVLNDIESKLSLVNNLFLEYHGNFDQMAELSDIFSLLNRAGFKYYIKEAADVYSTPFQRTTRRALYDLQLNIFCFRT